MKEKKNYFDGLVSIREAANETNFAEKTIRNWRVRGKFPEIFVKIAGKVFVDLNEMNNKVKQQKISNKRKRNW